MQLQITGDSWPDYRDQKWRCSFWTQRNVRAVWTWSCHLTEDTGMGLAGPAAPCRPPTQPPASPSGRIEHLSGFPARKEEDVCGQCHSCHGKARASEGQRPLRRQACGKEKTDSLSILSAGSLKLFEASNVPQLVSRRTPLGWGGAPTFSKCSSRMPETKITCLPLTA